MTLFTISLSAQYLKLQESINKTLANHPDIKTFMLKIAQSEQGYKSSRSDYLPQITLQGQYDPVRTYVLPVNGEFSTINDDGYSAGVTLKQKIWDFSKTHSKIEMAEVEHAIAKLSLSDAQALMTYRVKLLYEQMIVQQEAIEVRRKDMEAKNALYNQAKALVAQGLKTEADSSRFLSAFYLAKENLAVSQGIFDKARVTLSLYMGEAIQADVILESNLLRRDDIVLAESALLAEQMLHNSPQLKIASQSVHKNELLYSSVKASRYGSIDAIASYTHQNTLNTYDTSLVGVSITVPIYAGGRISSEAQQARIGASIAKEQRNSKVLTLRDELSALLVDMKRYSQTIETKQAQFASAEATKEIVEARYKEGLTTYIEVLDAISLSLNAELGLLEAWQNRSSALNRINYLIGSAQ